MRLPSWLTSLVQPRLFAICPLCRGDARGHPVRTLARERYAPGGSGIEGLLERGDFTTAAALDDPRAMGDLLVHQLLRCGDRTLLVTVLDPLAFEPRIRTWRQLDTEEADRARQASQE